MGYMPEGVNCNEIIYEIIAHNAFGAKTRLEDFIPYYLKTRYGLCDERLTRVWLDFCREVLNGQLLISGESALCARPTLGENPAYRKDPSGTGKETAAGYGLSLFLRSGAKSRAACPNSPRPLDFCGNL